MSVARAFRLPPAGRAIGPRELAGLVGAARAPARLRRALADLLHVEEVHLHASGREALRVARAGAATRTGRREVVLPAYTCFSVAAAAVAAGLRVRLVDVTAAGAIDPASLARTPLERAAALVVCNLFGFAEPMARVVAAAHAAGAELIDDAAQALGARAADGAAGTRGDVGVLSFGRGKPLSALGGGALVYAAAAREVEPQPAPGRRVRALLHAIAYDAALSPRVFGWLATLPGLGIGETPFEPDFSRGGLAEDAAALALAVLPQMGEDASRRREEAARLGTRLRERTCLVPIEAAPGSTGVYPRLSCLAPDASARDRAVAVLLRVGAGVSTMYPTPLGEIPGLAHHLEGERAMPGARDLSARLLTLPTHGGLRGAHLHAALQALNDAGCT